MSVTRRSLIRGSAGLAVSALLPLRAFARDAGTTPSADEALAALIEGNRNFAAGIAEPAFKVTQLPILATGQQPIATIVCCSDSRVPPELIFQAGFGKLFVVRNAGNTTASVQSLGSVEYSVANLKVPLIVVLGHSECGAVKAATSVVQNNSTYPGSIGPLIEPILPAALAVRDHPGSPLDNGIVENVQRVTARLRSPEQPILYPLQRAGTLKIVGGVYDMVTGTVRLVDVPEGMAIPGAGAERRCQGRPCPAQ